MIEKLFQLSSQSSLFNRMADRVLKKVLPCDRTWPITIPLGPLRGFRLELNLFWEREFLFGTYEPQTIRTVQRLTRTGMTCYDVGAHVGYYTLLLAKLVNPTGRVVAFEPSPSVSARLNQNILLNKSKVQTTIETLQIAIADKKEHRCFFKGGATTTGRLVRIPQDASESSLFNVECESLDALVFKYGLSSPDIVKIDVEYAEDLVLRGMARLLSEVRPIIICEIHDAKNGQKIFSHLTREGYRTYSMESSQELLHPQQVVSGHIFGIPLNGEIPYPELS